MTPALSRLRLVALLAVSLLAIVALGAGIVAQWDPSAITRVLAAAIVAVLLLADAKGGPPPTPPPPLARAVLAYLAAEGAGELATALGAFHA